MKIETILTPAELPALAQRDLRATACVVFDVLRATSTFVTALHHGAKAIIPVSEIAKAVAFKNSEFGIRNPESILLGGERNGIRISAEGIDFDLGNSPREYTPEKVRGKTIVSTTARLCERANGFGWLVFEPHGHGGIFAAGKFWKCPARMRRHGRK